MPKKAPELSAAQVRRLAKRPGKHAVGGVAGLLLQVKKDTGAASWLLRIKIGDRRPDIGLGGYPDTSLEQARARARELRDQVYQGIDPLAARKAAQDALRVAAAKRLTFDEAAVKCWRARSQEFRNEKHARQWLQTIKNDASPIIGALPVADIEVAHVVRVLEPIWTTKTESASRLRGRIETVLEWARVAGYRDGQDNPASWRTLQHVLPAPGKLKRKNGARHYAALPWEQAPEFMLALREREGMAARALEFAILTAARSGEVRLATWPEIDLGARIWTVPGERMKAGLTHRVPLPAPAIALLESLPRFAGSPYVFPAPRGGALSDMALSAVCRRMGYIDPIANRAVTPHGFRSTFKDWARTSTAYPDEVSELALAHVNDDKTRAAYARDELLGKRARLMRDWAKFLTSRPTRAAITAIGTKR